MTMCVKCLDAMMIVMLLVMETSGRGLGAAARQFSHRQGIRYLVLWYSTIQCRVLNYSMWGAVVFNEWCSRSWCNVLWLVHELHRGLWIGGNGDYSGLLLCGKAVSKLSGVYIKTHQLLNKINTQIEGSFLFWTRAVGIRIKSTSDLQKVT